VAITVSYVSPVFVTKKVTKWYSNFRHVTFVPIISNGSNCHI